MEEGSGLHCDPGDLAEAEAVAASDGFLAVRDRILSTDATTIGHQIELTEIPSPPFGEEVRGRRMAELLAEAGAGGVTIDAEGNVVSRYRGSADAEGPPIVVAAHLDTVFPAETDVSATRDGNLIRAPGISDDGRGLAALLAVCRALTQEGVAFSHPLLFVATVGEEGPGNLRGVRHLFSPGGAGHGAAAFISLDGAGNEGVVHRGLGSRRFRVEVEGPGGHSWTDRGRANPILALSEGLAGLRRIEVPPATSLSVGRIGGGTSVNAIPQSAWAEVEIRSENESSLSDLEPEVHRLLTDAVEAANTRRRPGSERLVQRIESMGARPAGQTPAGTLLVRAAAAATRVYGREPVSVLSSTDANVPMSLGIPAITMGAGGEAGSAHTTDEWYRNKGGPDGIARAALTLLLLERLTG